MLRSRLVSFTALGASLFYDPPAHPLATPWPPVNRYTFVACVTVSARKERRMSPFSRRVLVGVLEFLCGNIFISEPQPWQCPLCTRWWEVHRRLNPRCSRHLCEVAQSYQRRVTRANESQQAQEEADINQTKLALPRTVGFGGEVEEPSPPLSRTSTSSSASWLSALSRMLDPPQASPASPVQSAFSTAWTWR